jgi:hypothetical protein
MKKRKKADDRPCAIPGCEENAKTAGFCAACYSAWYRLRDLSMPEIGRYLWQKRRLIARVPILSRRRSTRGSKARSAA